MDNKPHFICPRCKSNFKNSEHAAIVCTACKFEYTKTEGVIRFDCIISAGT
jgi:hypothetical protein